MRSIMTSRSVYVLTRSACRVPILSITGITIIMFNVVVVVGVAVIVPVTIVL